MAQGASTNRGPEPKGFDFTFHAGRLCADLCQRLSELRHIDMGRVAVRYCQVRRAGAHGLQASLTPLRFEEGRLHTMRHGRHWTIQRLYSPQGQEMLYLLSFYLPRFLNQSFEEKLATVVHELWHVSPQFNGDVRRFSGRCYAHGHSEEDYHASMRELSRRWLALNPPPEIYNFLHCDFEQLRNLYGAIYGVRIATPRLLPAVNEGVRRQVSGEKSDGNGFAPRISRSRRSGRPAIGSCCVAVKRRSCRGGRSSTTRPRKTGTMSC